MFTKEKKKKNRDFFFSRVSHTKNNYRVIISYNYTVIIFCVGNPAKIPPLQLFPDVNYGILKTPLLEGFWLEEIILRLLKFETNLLKVSIYARKQFIFPLSHFCNKEF